MNKVVKLVTVKAKRMDWTKKAGTVVRERSLVKTELERKDARIAELTGKLGAVVTRVAEMAKEKEALAEQHKQAVDAGLRACEEAKETKVRLEKALHDLELYMKYGRDCDKTINELVEKLKQKDSKIEELRGERVTLHCEKTGMVKAARGLHEALGTLLNLV